MAKYEKRIPPHLRAKREIAARAKELARPDGSLPAERELAEIIGVCRETLRKALDELTCEAFIRNVPRRGNFLTGAAPQPQIAIAHRGFNIPYPRIVSGVFDTLIESGSYWLNVVRVRDLADAAMAIRDYGLAGIVWLDELEGLGELMESSTIPMTAVPIFANLDSPSFDLKSSYVAMDGLETARRRAGFMLERGHRRLACAGACPERMLQGVRAAFEERGLDFSTNFLAIPDEELQEKLPAALAEDGVSAMICEGGSAHLETLFELLSSLPSSGSLELELPLCPNAFALRRRFPAVKIASLTRIPEREAGCAAARMLLRSLAGGGPQKPELIPGEPEAVDA